MQEQFGTINAGTFLSLLFLLLPCYMWVIKGRGKFITAGIEFTVLPVLHGEDYWCYGFMFGTRERCVYLSDVSRVPEETMTLLMGVGQIALLIVDCLFKHRQHNTHFCLSDSLEFIRKVRPKRALLTGLTHQFDHHKDNQV